jgi:hypothetical protein
MAFDPSIISQIPDMAPNPMAAKANAFKLADLIDSEQLNRLQLNAAKTGQADAAEVKEIMKGADYSTPQGITRTAEKLSKAGHADEAMKFMGTMQKFQTGEIEQQRQKLELAATQQDQLAGALDQVYGQLEEWRAKGASPAMLDAKAKELVIPAMQNLAQANPELGPTIAKFGQNPQNLTYAGIKTSEAQSNKGQALLKQHLDELRAFTGAKAEAEKERHDKAMETAANKRISNAQSGELAPEDLKMMADQYLTGDKSVFQNIGRGAQGAKNIVALRSAIRQTATDRGMTGKDVAAKIAEFNGIMAGERTLGTRTANVEMAVNEAYNMIDIARKASNEISRSGFMPLAKLEQAYQRNVNDPKLAQAVAATNSLINAYARAVSPTGTPTVSDKDHAREVLSTAQSKEAYDAVLDQLANEMEAARASPGQVRKEFREGVTTGQGVTPKAPEKQAKTVSWADLK